MNIIKKDRTNKYEMFRYKKAIHNDEVADKYIKQTVLGFIPDLYNL